MCCALLNTWAVAQTRMHTVTITRSPANKVSTFGSELSLDTRQRRDTATALAELVQNHCEFRTLEQCRLANRAIALAQRIDANNANAARLDSALTTGQPIMSDENWNMYAALSQIRKTAALCKDSKVGSDQILAACLYELASQFFSTQEDWPQLDQLNKRGVSPDWQWATDVRGFRSTSSGMRPSDRGANANAVPPNQGPAGVNPRQAATRAVPVETPTFNVRPLTTIHGLVVMAAPDGRYHGKVVDIIAAVTGKSFSTTQMRRATEVGKEMSISFDEALRLARMRQNGLDRAGLEISFGDKYSQKDGGSAGTGFAVLLLSAMGNFEVSDNVALTGDITVDGKVRAVGEVAAKAHGAALDRMDYVCVPADCAAQMEDAILLDGPSVLWEVQMFSMATLDDAIALVRKDKDPKLVQAMSLFSAMRASYATATIESLKADEPAAKLNQILLLAPNHVSAKYLQQLASGKAPATLSLAGSIEQALLAVGPMRQGLSEKGKPGPGATNGAALAACHKNLAKAKAMANPSALPLFAPLDSFCTAYAKLGMADPTRMDPRTRRSMEQDLEARKNAVRQAVMTLISDRDVIDKLLHP